jgi:hypothetical protein
VVENREKENREKEQREAAERAAKEKETINAMEKVNIDSVFR